MQDRQVGELRPAQAPERYCPLGHEDTQLLQVRSELGVQDKTSYCEPEVHGVHSTQKGFDVLVQEPLRNWPAPQDEDVAQGAQLGLETDEQDPLR